MLHNHHFCLISLPRNSNNLDFSATSGTPSFAVSVSKLSRIPWSTVDPLASLTMSRAFCTSTVGIKAVVLSNLANKSRTSFSGSPSGVCPYRRLLTKSAILSSISGVFLLSTFFGFGVVVCWSISKLSDSSCRYTGEVTWSELTRDSSCNRG